MSSNYQNSDEFRREDQRLCRQIDARAERMAAERMREAAPEMLEALKEAVALADRNLSQFSGRTQETQACYDRCVAAISLAEGRIA
jgi:hypothetical protein